MKQFNAILKTFTKTLEKLEKLQEQRNKQVAVNTYEIDKLRDKNLELIAESQAAKNVAHNLRQIIKSEAND